MKRPAPRSGLFFALFLLVSLDEIQKVKIFVVKVTRGIIIVNSSARSADKCSTRKAPKHLSEGKKYEDRAYPISLVKKAPDILYFFKNPFVVNLRPGSMNH